MFHKPPGSNVFAMTLIPAEFASSAQVKRSCCPKLMPERNEVSATASPNDLLAATEAVAEQLNLGCFCISLDREELEEALDRAVRIEGFAERLSASHPTLFSNVPVFVPSVTLGKMMLIVDAVEGAAQLPAYGSLTCRNGSCCSRPASAPKCLSSAWRSDLRRCSGVRLPAS